MSAGFAALFASPLADGIVLAQLLVLYRYLNTARQLTVAAMHSTLTIIVLCSAGAIADACNALFPGLMPAAPYSRWLQLFMLAAMIALLAQCSALVLRRTQPLLALHMPNHAGILAMNCLVLLVLLHNTAFGPDFAAMLQHAFGASFGFALLLMLFAGLRPRIDTDAVPRLLRGLPVATLTLALLVLALAGFVSSSSDPRGAA